MGYGPIKKCLLRYSLSPFCFVFAAFTFNHDVLRISTFDIRISLLLLTCHSLLITRHGSYVLQGLFHGQVGEGQGFVQSFKSHGFPPVGFYREDRLKTSECHYKKDIN